MRDEKMDGQWTRKVFDLEANRSLWQTWKIWLSFYPFQSRVSPSTKFSIYVFVISSAVDELNKQLPFVFRIACIPLIKNLSGKAPTGTI